MVLVTQKRANKTLTTIKTKSIVDVVFQKKMPASSFEKVERARMGVSFSLNQLEAAKSYAETAFLSRGIYAFIIVYELEKVVTIFYEPFENKTPIERRTPRKKTEISSTRGGATTRKYRGRSY